VDHTSSGVVSLPFGAAFRADLDDRFVDDALDFIRVGIGFARPHVLNSALKHASAPCTKNGVFKPLEGT